MGTEDGDEGASVAFWVVVACSVVVAQSAVVAHTVVVSCSAEDVLV